MIRDSITGIVIFWSLVVMIVLFFAWITLVIVRHEAARDAWMTEHQCKPSGYVGGDVWSSPKRLYRCDDGDIYIRSDIPTR